MQSVYSTIRANLASFGFFDERHTILRLAFNINAFIEEQ